ncbi:Membrane protein of ER body-like protein, partial [Cucurbita argyrosperma subsp. argyrosperma]
MEAVVDRPVAAETENQPTPAAGESKSRAMKLSRTSSSDSDEVYSDTDTDTDVNVENQRLYELPNSNDFYCPNCVSNISRINPRNTPYRRKRPQVDPYEEAFGDRQNYLLHYTAIILSFLLIGLLPPLVYSFSFRHTDGNNLKLAVVGVTSLLCIALLAIAKAYVRKPLHKYVKTLVCYIVLGLGVFGLSYLGGKVLGKLLEPLGSHFVAL